MVNSNKSDGEQRTKNIRRQADEYMVKILIRHDEESQHGNALEKNLRKGGTAPYHQQMLHPTEKIRKNAPIDRISV